MTSLSPLMPQPGFGSVPETRRIALLERGRARANGNGFLRDEGQGRIGDRLRRRPPQPQRWRLRVDQNGCRPTTPSFEIADDLHAPPQRPERRLNPPELSPGRALRKLETEQLHAATAGTALDADEKPSRQ